MTIVVDQSGRQAIRALVDAALRAGGIEAYDLVTQVLRAVAAGDAAGSDKKNAEGGSSRDSV